MPWSAITAPPGARGGPSAAPAALELILGQADPDDEGVPAYRVDPKSDQGARALEALQAWDRATMEAIGAPAGWHLEALDRDVRPGRGRSHHRRGRHQHPEPSTPRAISLRARRARRRGLGRCGGDEHFRSQEDVMDGDRQGISPWLIGGLATVGLVRSPRR
jgi:hypothetical protein